MHRILLTLFLLVLYRIGCYIPLPGVNTSLVGLLDYGVYDGTLSALNLFLGGNLGRLSIFSLNLVPYLSASLLLYGLTMISTRFSHQLERTWSGQVIKYTYPLTFFVAIVQYHFLLLALGTVFPALILFEWWRFYALSFVTLLLGLFSLIWLSEQIDVYGVGKGVSLIVLVGILSELPTRFLAIYSENSVIYFVMTLSASGCLLGVMLYVETIQYRLLIALTDEKISGEPNSFSKMINLRGPFSGLLPLLLSSTILSVLSLLQPTLLSGFFLPGRISYQYLVGHGLLLTALLFILRSVSFDVVRYTTQFYQAGGLFPYVRPGVFGMLFTDSHVLRFLSLNWVYLTVVALLPEVLQHLFSATCCVDALTLFIVVRILLLFLSQTNSKEY